MDNNDFLNNVMRDLKVELDDEFDRNFERKAFFDRPWAPLSPNYNLSEGSMLMRTGALRRSLHSRIDGTRLIYESSLKYAGLQNYGGTVRQDFVPSDKMRRWAWAKARERREQGDKPGEEKFRRMALAKRIRRTISVPARPFIGEHPRIREIAAEVVRENAEKTLEEAKRAFKS